MATPQANVPLTLYLEHHSNARYLDTNEGWKAWVSDFRQIIYNKSTIYTIKGSDLIQSRFDIRRWLRTINANEASYWIVQIINQISSDIFFYDGNIPKSLRVPDSTLLEAQYQSYLNSAASSALYA